MCDEEDDCYSAVLTPAMAFPDDLSTLLHDPFTAAAPIFHPPLPQGTAGQMHHPSMHPLSYFFFAGSSLGQQPSLLPSMHLPPALPHPPGFEPSYQSLPPLPSSVLDIPPSSVPGTSGGFSQQPQLSQHLYGAVSSTSYAPPSTHLFGAVATNHGSAAHSAPSTMENSFKPPIASPMVKKAFADHVDGGSYVLACGDAAPLRLNVDKLFTLEISDPGLDTARAKNQLELAEHTQEELRFSSPTTHIIFRLTTTDGYPLSGVTLDPAKRSPSRATDMGFAFRLRINGCVRSLQKRWVTLNIEQTTHNPEDRTLYGEVELELHSKNVFAHSTSAPPIVFSAVKAPSSPSLATPASGSRASSAGPMRRSRPSSAKSRSHPRPPRSRVQAQA